MRTCNCKYTFTLQVTPRVCLHHKTHREEQRRSKETRLGGERKRRKEADRKVSEAWAERQKEQLKDNGWILNQMETAEV